jgi:imidazole glycerol-phosphate synthase subunit HisH
MIALVDAGCGNLRSVQRSLEYVGARDVTITSDPDAIARASRVVFPGQGAFGDCARALDADGGALRGAVESALTRGVRFLGICIGMQVLFEASDEAPGARGLGHLRGRVERIPDGLVEHNGARVKVPHMGWNVARPTAATTVLGDTSSDGAWFYFVHSFHCVPSDPAVPCARTTHGVDFVSAVAKDNVLAVQFHPEKSQRAGHDLLSRWLKEPS